MNKKILTKYISDIINLSEDSLKEINKEEKYSKSWNKEDDEIVNDIIEYLECWNDFDSGDEPFDEYRARFKKYIEWMKTVKMRITEKKY